MSDPVDRIKDMVRRSLVTNPDVSNRELYDRAKEIAPELVEGLSLVQFHARYRLPIMRNEMSSRPRESKVERRPRRRLAPRPAVPIRSQLREVLVRFAVELENASSRSELVKVIGNLDTFIDEIVGIARRGEAVAPEEPQAKPEPVEAPKPAEAQAPPPPLRDERMELFRSDPIRSDRGLDHRPTAALGRMRSERPWPPTPKPNPFREP